MATVDRLQGVRTSKAIKGPVVAATTANITLSGEQTIDGVALVAGDRVLVKDQTTTTENGIYVVATAAWARAADFNRADDIDQGTLVAIAQGTVNGNAMWILTTENPVVAATALVFSRYADPAGVAAADASAAAALASEIAAAASEAAAGVSESNADADRIAAQAAAAAAAVSETNAGNSETAAGASETAAGLSETAAALSETNAGNSETAAAASAAAALVSEGNAATSETNAAASEAGVDADRIAAQAAAAAAAISESNAATSESNAATSETNAGTSETNAGTSETNAGNSETAAIAAQAAAEAALDEFTDLYLGAFAANPTLDNDGNALQDGALYWNNVALEVRAYDLGTTTWYTAPSFNSADYVLNAGDTMTGQLRIAAGGETIEMIGTNAFIGAYDEGDDTTRIGYVQFRTDYHRLGIDGAQDWRVSGGQSLADNDSIVTRSLGDARYYSLGDYPQQGETDFDNIVDGGFYTLSGSFTNGPSGAGSFSYTGTLQVWERAFTAGPRVTQVVSTNGTTPTLFVRVGTGAGPTWGAWTQIITGLSAEFTSDVQITSANPTIVFEDSDVSSILNELSLNGAYMTVDLDMNSNTSAAGFNVDYQGGRLFGVSHLGAHFGAQVSGENRTLTLNGTDALKLPVGTTAQQPSGAEEGEIRGNSDDNAVEYFDGTDWVQLGSGGGASTVIDYQEFTASGTWNKPAGAATGDKVKVQVVGGGGGGGSSSTGSPGGGGGGGAIALFDDVDDLPASASTVVGSGGTGPSGDGGTSSFGTSGDEWFLQATGGVAGGTSFNTTGGVGGTVRYGRTNGNDQGDMQDGGQGGESNSSPFVGSSSITGGGGGGGAGTNNTNATAGGPSMMAGAGGQGGGNALTTERQGRFPGGGGGGRDTTYGGSIGDGAAGVVRVWVIRE